MRFARGDMRDHIVSHQNDQGASYRRYGVLQWPRRLKINFCEIFDVVRFSTFATISPYKQTSLPCVGMSQKCQKAASTWHNAIAAANSLPIARDTPCQHGCERRRKYFDSGGPRCQGSLTSKASRTLPGRPPHCA